MIDAVEWRPETPDLFSATAYTHADRLYLVVERKPDGGWDWLAWADALHPWHGEAQDTDAAMRAAERAASRIRPI